MIFPVAVRRINKKRPLKMSLVCKLSFPVFLKISLVLTALSQFQIFLICAEWHGTSFNFSDKNVNLGLFRCFWSGITDTPHVLH